MRQLVLAQQVKEDACDTYLMSFRVAPRANRISPEDRLRRRTTRDMTVNG